MLFTQPSRAIAAIKILADSGTAVSRISIQTWGSGIAIRARDAIDPRCLDQLLALGGEPIEDHESPVARSRRAALAGGEAFTSASQ